MREISYLHLTRFVRILLDRKDRMSMAVGLEVRVPFCDHRLVEYVYNTPWAMKTYRRPGEEPAARRDPRRAAGVGGEAGQEPVPVDVGSPVRRGDPGAREGSVRLWRRLAVQPDRPRGSGAHHRTGSAQLQPVERTRIERVLDLAVWIDMYQADNRTSDRQRRSP